MNRRRQVGFHAVFEENSPQLVGSRLASPEVALNPMQWFVVVLLLAVLVLVVVLKRTGLVSVADAITHLRGGAVVADVRTRREYDSQHLAGAINLPLGDLKKLVAGAMPDSKKVLLLYCYSGGRSGMAVRLLAPKREAPVFNLGSYERAARILAAAARKDAAGK
jgi:phage shock protein E